MSESQWILDNDNLYIYYSSHVEWNLVSEAVTALGISAERRKCLSVQMIPECLRYRMQPYRKTRNQK